MNLLDASVVTLVAHRVRAAFAGKTETPRVSAMRHAPPVQPSKNPNAGSSSMPPTN